MNKRLIEKELLRLLKKLNIELYQINALYKTSYEYFFEKHDLRLKRKKDIYRYTVRVYADFWIGGKHYLGDATVKIDEMLSNEQIEEKLIFAYNQAQLVKNEYYELPVGRRRMSVEPCCSLALNRNRIINKLFKVDRIVSMFSSIELCFIDYEMRFLDSNGICRSYNNWRLNGEIVTKWEGINNVTLTRNINYSCKNIRNIKVDIENQIMETRQRACARPNKVCGKYDVVITGENVKNIFQYFVCRCNAQYIYMGYSDAKTNERIGPQYLTITLFPVDKLTQEGIMPRKRLIIEDGVVKRIHGLSRFSYYLGQKATGGMVGIKVSPSHKKIDKDKEKIEIVQVSDFQMDPVTSTFCAEIRLAYYTTEEGRIPITGGSISGRLSECFQEYESSRTLIKQMDYIGPRSIKLRNVSVSTQI